MAIEAADPLDVRSMAGALGELAAALLGSGSIDARSLGRAQRVAAETGARLDRVITDLGMVSERALAEAMASLLGVPVVRPADYPDAPLFPERLHAKFLRRARAVPIAAEADRVTLAMVDPLDSFTREAVAVPVEFEAAFERLYAEADMPDAAAAPLDDLLSGSQPVEEDAERLRDLASEAPVIRLVNQMIARAVETHASDVHLEPFPDRLRVRYRYDGLLHEVEPPPAQLQAAVISRIKIMARLDIAERRLPQDGRIKLTVRGQDIDFRVSTVPALHGETVVLRVLDRTAVEFDYDRLGFAPDIR